MLKNTDWLIDWIYEIHIYIYIYIYIYLYLYIWYIQCTNQEQWKLDPHYIGLLCKIHSMTMSQQPSYFFFECILNLQQYSSSNKNNTHTLESLHIFLKSNYTWLFKSFEFGNGSRMSDKKLVILEFKYLQKKKSKKY